MKKQNPAEPADIRNMAIVHSALRRDLVRTRLVLTGAAPIDAARTRALGEHLLWMMDMLHHHHSGEDTHVWPEIRRRNPAAGPLIDDMNADHERIAEPLRALERTATSFTSGSASAPDLLAALDRLENPLLPHLAREEREMMPLVAQTLSQREWLDLDYRAFVKGKSPWRLGLEGHWIIDHATDADRDRMVAVIAAVPRFILLHGFRRRYARKVRALWAGTPAAEVAPVTAEA